MWGGLATVWRLSSAAGIHDARLEKKHAISIYIDMNMKQEDMPRAFDRGMENEKEGREECCPYRRMTAGRERNLQELGVDPWEEGYTEDDEDDEEAEDEGKKAIL